MYENARIPVLLSREHSINMHSSNRICVCEHGAVCAAKLRDIQLQHIAIFVHLISPPPTPTRTGSSISRAFKSPLKKQSEFQPRKDGRKVPKGLGLYVLYVVYPFIAPYLSTYSSYLAPSPPLSLSLSLRDQLNKHSMSSKPDHFAGQRLASPGLWSLDPPSQSIDWPEVSKSFQVSTLPRPCCQLVTPKPTNRNPPRTWMNGGHRPLSDVSKTRPCMNTSRRAMLKKAKRLFTFF